MESDINPIARQICGEFSELFKQPIFLFQLFFMPSLINNAERIKDEKETCGEYSNDAFVNLKIKQIIALEDLDEKETDMNLLQLLKSCE